MHIHTTPGETCSQPAPADDLVSILEQALRLAEDGRLTDADRARLWMLAAEGALEDETVQRLVELDEAGRRRWAHRRRNKPPATRQQIREALADEIPVAIRRTANLRLAWEALLAILVIRAELVGEEWRAEISMTELERLLGDASRRTVREAIKALEARGLVRVIRRRRTRRFNETNVYVLTHRALVEAAEQRAAKRTVRRVDSGRVLRDPGSCMGETPSRKTTKRARGAARCKGLQGGTSPTAAPNPVPSVQPDTGNGAEARPREPGLPPDTIQKLLQRLTSNSDALVDTDLWRIAERLLATELSKFSRKEWKFARFRHGNRAALAVIETVLVTRHRARTAGRIRSPAAYLGAILKRPPGECLPEVTLRRLAANTNIRLDIPQAFAG